MSFTNGHRSFINYGSSNRSIYDSAQTAQYIADTTSPFALVTDFTKYENCKKCRGNTFPTRYSVVDVESDLLNLSRPLSNSGWWKYNPNGCFDNKCITTNDSRVPPILDTLCPIVFNNIKKPTNPGFRNSNLNICRY